LPVKPTRVTMATAGIAQSPCSWSIDDLCKIAVYNGNPEHTDAKVILECFLTDRKHVELKSDKVAGKLRVMLPVLPRGQTQSREMLQETFTIFMSGYVKKELNFITIPIDNLKTWTQSLFCETILESFLYWKEVRRPSYIVKLTICALGSYSFDEAVKVCNKVIAGTHKKSISNKDSRYHSLSVHIVEGSLDKMKADALACTVSSNMDLLRGAVSEALLKRGGIKLQEDLDAKSHGRLPFGDIVAVPGHKLDCTHVLFGVMYPFSKKYAKGFRSLEQYYRSSVHEFVQKCLNLAEEKKLRTIAFPAVGAGNLQYPIDVVADQMFKTVINWSGVYVEKVAFVIYQSDKDVLKEFQLAEKQH
ncbi:uncharacterized protein LOC128551709, partial [Mercenaria mercenaria]|uniref:uncharacterized protein LOC128551709 n=1 Tax=Mercenaria mercenaria TaxID=6596 RepID=UPI00234F8F7C